MSNENKALLVICFIIILPIVFCVMSALAVSVNVNYVKPQLITTGYLVPCYDCFGDIIDYSINDIDLVGDDIVSKYGNNIFVAKLNSDIKGYGKEGLEFITIDESRIGDVYSIYIKESNFLWFHSQRYFIGCDN